MASLDELTIELQSYFVSKSWSLAIAESCTGGALAAKIVEQPGASHYFRGAVVCYQDEIKNKILGVNHKIIEAKSAVSSEVALSMAQSVRNKFNSTWAVSTTGFAGPTGGSLQTPVGTLYVGLVGPQFEGVEGCQIKAVNRKDFLIKAVEFAVEKICKQTFNKKEV